MTTEARGRVEEAGPPSGRRRSVVTLIIIGVVAAGLLAVVGVVGVPLLADGSTTVSTPDRAGGLTRDTSAGRTDLLNSADGAENLDQPANAVYGDSGDAVVVHVGYLVTARVGAEAEQALANLGTDGNDVGNRRTYPAPGAVGGALACDQVYGPGGGAPVLGRCVWTNHRAMVVALMHGRYRQNPSAIMTKLLPDLVHT